MVNETIWHPFLIGKNIINLQKRSLEKSKQASLMGKELDEGAEEKTQMSPVKEGGCNRNL